MSDHYSGLLLVVSGTSLGDHPFRYVFGIGKSLIFVFSGSRSCEVLGLAWLGFCVVSSNSFFIVKPCICLWVLVAPLFCV